METIELIKNLDVKILCSFIAIVGSLSGVIIGAFLTAIFASINNLISYNMDENRYFKRKKEETYLEMEDLITDYCAHLPEMKKINTINRELREKYNNIRSKAHIYAKKKISDQFYKILNQIMTEAIVLDNLDVKEWDKLSHYIKQDLNIKD